MFRERLLPTPPLWALFGAAPAALGVAYGAAFSATIGWATFALGLVTVGILVVLGSPVIQVTADELLAGKARIPRSIIAHAAALDATAFRNEMRTLATAFTLVRAWHGPRGVRVDLADSADPHPAWLLSTRHPDALIRALVE